MNHTRLRPAQVGASTAAAVGAAFLASRLGVYGTIIGVGVISLMSTVGSEMLIRSLDRTREAARTTSLRQRLAPSLADETGELVTMPAAAHTVPLAPAAADTIAGQPTVTDGPGPAPPRRWPLVVGGSLASFGLAIAVITGIEAFSGHSVAGSEGATIVNVFRGDGPSVDDAPSAPGPTTAPSPVLGEDGTSTGNPADDAPSPEPTSPTDTPSDGETPPPDDATSPPDDGETPPAQDEIPPADGGETSTPAPGETPAP